MDKKWFYEFDGERKGPHTLETMYELIGASRIGRDNLVWREGFEDWVAAASAVEFESRFSQSHATEPPPLKVYPKNSDTHRNDEYKSGTHQSKFSNARITTKIIIASLLPSFIIGLNSGELSSISTGFGFFLGTLLGIVAISYLIVFIPAGLYWLVKRKLMPGFDKTLWVIWATISVMIFIADLNR